MSFVKTCGKLVLAGLVTLALSVPALAQEVTTKYFAGPPDGWTQPQPVQEGNGALMAIFQSKKDGSAVTVNRRRQPHAVRQDVATQTAANMKQGSVTVSVPSKDGVYECTFSQGQGKAFPIRFQRQGILRDHRARPQHRHRRRNSSRIQAR